MGHLLFVEAGGKLLLLRHILVLLPLVHRGRLLLLVVLQQAGGGDLGVREGGAQVCGGGEGVCRQLPQRANVPEPDLTKSNPRIESRCKQCSYREERGSTGLPPRRHEEDES